MCTRQNDASNHAGSSPSTTGTIAIWGIKVVVNLRTAITQVGLPYYNRKDPQQGSKQARDSILKLLTGMNNDVQPLNFRSELKQNGDKDPYFPAAPAWSTLSGGNNPTHLCTPAQLCGWLLEAIECVPSVKGVEIYMLEGVTQTLTTLPDLCAREIVMAPVPFLPVSSNFSAPNVGVNDAAVQRANADVERARAAETTAKAAEATAKAAEATALTQLNMQAAFIADLQKKFDAQADQVKGVQEQLKAMAAAKASVPKPNPTARPNPQPCPIPGLAINRCDPVPKPNQYPYRTLTLTPRPTRWRCLPPRRQSAPRPRPSCRKRKCASRSQTNTQMKP